MYCYKFPFSYLLSYFFYKYVISFVAGVVEVAGVVKLGNIISANFCPKINIITNTKDDVLLVSSSAVKSDDNGNNYVQILKNGKPVNQNVEIGLSSDSQTEITSGLKEGDVVITSTIAATTTKTSTQTQSVFGGLNSGRNSGGGIRSN